MTATRARRCLAIALFVRAALAATSVEAAAPSPSPQAEAAKAQAKAAIDRARAAAKAGDHDAALAGFEEALRLWPSAKLHFNIGVCHHRAMAEHEPGSVPYEQHRAAAVTAYDDYLKAAPHASDAEDVEAMIRALGGTPADDDTQPWTIELVEPDDVPDPPGLDESDDPLARPTPPPESQTTTTTPPATAPRPPPPTGPRGRVGPFLPLISSHPRDLAASTELRPLPALGLGVRGNAFLGQRRLIGLGGELAIALQPTSASTRHRLHVAYLGVLVEARHPLGRRGRFELGGGGVLGFGTQSLVYDGDEPLRCAVGGTRNDEASRRTGLWASTRVTLAALLGPRRNHELSLRLGPGLSAYGAGSSASEDADGQGCADEPSAFEHFGLREGPALVVSVDIGYAPRF
ncbi:hypothetical protein [Paraliomyxa miuraensis]|uniref:hypothetical protein n=1 Tax=Paraliomyxa miuraensis TaxID=376150 RepID=UPI0022578DA1|nr:hypothetical protein [Paraliomyxa miuraensis]MCX4245908.1 hypothetical protein [Paraliomyxa miuraensis]